MALRQIKCPTGPKKIDDDVGPEADVGKPMDSIPSDEYQVERSRLGKRVSHLIEVSLDKLGSPS
jgi:hypothetical protein